jgi:hypothetical protein
VTAPSSSHARLPEPLAIGACHQHVLAEGG